MTAAEAAITGPEVVTAIVAGVALTTSIISLFLQYVLWSRSGARIKVEARNAVLVGAVGMGASNVVLDVTAYNRGRAAAQVTNWWLEPARAKVRSLVFPRMIYGGLPVTVEPYSSVSWAVDWMAARTGAIDNAGSPFVRVGIALGDGSKVFGPAFELHDVTTSKG